MIGLSTLLRRLPLLALLIGQALLGRGTGGLLALLGSSAVLLLAPLLRGLSLLLRLAPLLRGLSLLLRLAPLLCGLTGLAGVLPPLVALHTLLLSPLLALRGHGTIGLTPLRRRGRLLSRCRGNV